MCVSWKSKGAGSCNDVPKLTSNQRRHTNSLMQVVDASVVYLGQDLPSVQEALEVVLL
jgi:hypothetical protein